MSLILELEPRVEEEARRLAEAEGLPLEQYVGNLIERAATVREEKKRSLLELKGLGKELWAGIDAQEYINQIRDEWER